MTDILLAGTSATATVAFIALASVGAAAPPVSVGYGVVVLTTTLVHRRLKR